MKETDFCPICRYYLYLKEEEKQEEKKSETKERVLLRLCRNCGYQEIGTGGLILEIDLKEKTSEGYKILMNQFTDQDPTLPHVKTIKCPTENCDTNTAGKENDVIYLKYDAVNMKFLYICNVCKTHWKSKA